MGTGATGSWHEGAQRSGKCKPTVPAVQCHGVRLCKGPSTAAGHVPATSTAIRRSKAGSHCLCPLLQGEVKGKHYSSKYSHGGCPSLWQYDLPTVGSSKSAHWVGTSQPVASNTSHRAAINHQTVALEDMPEKACRVINWLRGTYLIHRSIRPSIWWLGLFLEAWCCL